MFFDQISNKNQCQYSLFNHHLYILTSFGAFQHTTRTLILATAEGWLTLLSPCAMPHRAELLYIIRTTNTCPFGAVFGLLFL